MNIEVNFYGHADCEALLTMTPSVAVPFDLARKHCKDDLRKTVESIFRFATAPMVIWEYYFRLMAITAGV